MKNRYQQIKFILETFRLFGNPEAPFWFLGLEESTDETISAEEQIEKQYNAAVNYGKKKITPLFENSSTSAFLGNTPDSTQPKHQPTWAGYIKLLLSVYDAEHATKKPWSTSDVKAYQQTRLGRSAKDPYGSCLMELFPLPRKTHSYPWIYKNLADQPDLAFLNSYKEYKKHPLTLQRSQILLNKVSEHNPRVLFCFGSDCRNHLLSTLNATPEKTVVTSRPDGKSLPVSFIHYGTTLLVFSFHPTAPGVSDMYWQGLGELVSQKLADRRIKAAA